MSLASQALKTRKLHSPRQASSSRCPEQEGEGWEERTGGFLGFPPSNPTSVRAHNWQGLKWDLQGNFNLSDYWSKFPRLDLGCLSHPPKSYKRR